MKTINNSSVILDTTTGEMTPIESGRYISVKELETRKINAKAKIDTVQRHKKDSTYRGPFTVALNRDFEDIYASGISDQTLNKIIYLSTYIDNNNKLVRDGGWQKATRIITPLTLQDIKNLLNVSDKPWRAFWREATENNLIIEKDGEYYLPRNMFRFCDTEYVDAKQTAMIKLFRHAVRYMYENTSNNTKRAMVHLYRLIPFINLTHNVMCENPFEKDIEKIVPLKMSDICRKLGIDVSNQTRFIRELKKLHFIDKQGKENSVITYRWFYKEEDIYWVTINPLFYSGYIEIDEAIEMADKMFLLKEDNK